MYRPVLVTPPAVTPVTLAEAKRQCKAEEFADRDAEIIALISAATSLLDGWIGILGRCLVEQTWRQDFDRLTHCLRIPLSPVIEVTHVNYYDVDGALQAIDAANYTLLEDDLGPYVKFLDTYSFAALRAERPAVSVTYSAGYEISGEGDAAVAAVPPAIKHAILMLVENWFENGSAVVVSQSGANAVALPFAVDALLAPFRRIRF